MSDTSLSDDVKGEIKVENQVLGEISGLRPLFSFHLEAETRAAGKKWFLERYQERLYFQTGLSTGTFDLIPS